MKRRRVSQTRSYLLLLSLSQKEFEADVILDHRAPCLQEAEQEFFWLCYGPEHNTWEVQEEFQALAGSMWCWLLALGGDTIQ